MLVGYHRKMIGEEKFFLDYQLENHVLEYCNSPPRRRRRRRSKLNTSNHTEEKQKNSEDEVTHLFHKQY
jgi:hypothetical protein